MSSFETITEYVDSRGATLTAQVGLIGGVKILGGNSRNGRSYPKETMVRAAPLYEGAKVNVNHPTGNPGQPRGYESRFGKLVNVRVGEGDSGLFADLQYNPEHALAKQLQWDAEHAPENVGMSHNVSAKITRRGKTAVVEEITKVQSVDLVADPATTRGLFEATNEPDNNKGADMSDHKLTLEELKADYPSHCEQIGNDAIAASEASAEKTAEKKALKEALEKIDKLELKEKCLEQAEIVNGLIAEAKLPKVAISDTFRKQLMEADEKARTELIEDRQALLKHAGPETGRPMSREQHTTEGDDSSLAGMTTEQIGKRWTA
jgi:hypothetical protein